MIIHKSSQHKFTCYVSSQISFIFTMPYFYLKRQLNWRMGTGA